MIKITSFFSSTLWTHPSIGIFHFYILKTSKFNSMWFSFCINLWSVNHILTCQRGTFKPVNMYILFYGKFANFWYIPYSAANLIPSWSQSHGLYSNCKCGLNSIFGKYSPILLLDPLIQLIKHEGMIDRNGTKSVLLSILSVMS